MSEEFSEKLGIDLEEGHESSAILVGVYKGKAQKELCEEHLEELENLADTFGVPTATKIAAPIRQIDAATFLQSGKIQEVAEAIASHEANLVIFDEEISPAQQRNLEKTLKVAVMDRTELILEIFAQRAQTKEAQLQIDLARTKYEYPRLKRLWSHFSRQRASGGFLKGEGEKQIELDRRMLQAKLDRLNKELKSVRKNRQTQSLQRRRSGIPTFAIVGYTNAGKSTLLNALTEADVLTEDKLFATLDPTTRKFTLPNNQEILLTDTVGFIRKLPHDLVAAFRSTLETALHDDVLMHLIDVSHPMALEQAETTAELLKTLDAQEESVITVLNKSDLCDDPTLFDKFRVRFPKTVVISAKERIGFDQLAASMIKELAERRQEVKLSIPQSKYALVATLRREGRIIYEEYEGDHVILRAEVPVTSLYQFERYRVDQNGA